MNRRAPNTAQFVATSLRQEAEIDHDARSLDLALVIPSLEKYGGAERVVIECLARWQKRHRITLYSAAINDRLLEEHGITDRVSRRLLTPFFEGEHALLLNAVLLPKLWRDEIGTHEIYHTHLWPTHLIDRHPMVWYPHEPLRMLHDLRYEQKYLGGESEGSHIYPKYDYDRFAARLFEPYLGAIAAADGTVVPQRVVANSRYCADYLEKVYGRKVDDIVYPGAEPTTPLELPRDPNLFVTVSQLWDHKRIRLLIEALALTNETQLIVIGSGPERDWLVELTERLGVSDRVFFLSGLKNTELELIFARASAFLFAPIREPFGIVVLEAFAAGLPLIAVNEGGYSELCTPENAFLVPPFPSAFAKKMSLFQSDPELRDRMGEAGRRTAVLYTWDRTARELEAVLLETAPPPPPMEPPGKPRHTLVGAQYYLWYAEGYGAAHWNDNAAFGHVADQPLLGYYGSMKGETIERHLGQFEAMGLDYAILNLHVDHSEINDIEAGSIDRLFRLAAERGSKLRFAVQIAPYSDDAEALATVVDRLRTQYMAHPNYLRLEGKPALFWFWTGAHDRRERLLAALAKATDGLVNIAAGLRLPGGAGEDALTHRLFSGFAPFSPLELADSANLENIWNLACRRADEAGMEYRVVSVSPGYDDTGLADVRRLGNPRRAIQRDGGETFARGLNWIEALSPRPDLVVVSTFNEFHENTHIEPSLGHGQTYVELTRQFVERLRSASDARP
ncbi:glycosyltransferase [Mesorhizobium sp. ZMM04-5]|uniref:Glycosyltransferase n=1 Tax=Mesorhizobium marinum TaxID=3228790 RepID=A0ABV3QX97_9HYPH